MIKKLFRLYNPIRLIFVALTYILGVGIARYLGYSLNFIVLGLGFLETVSLQGAAYFLAEYFRLPLLPREQDESPRQRERFRVVLLEISYAALTLAIVVVLSLLFARSLTLSASFIIFLAFLCMVVYSIPPMRFSETGYGELILAIYLGTIVPAMGFLLQSGEPHRLLTFISFPLTLLALAFLIVSDFPTYATDQKLSRNTLLTRLTWQYAVPVHHILILLTFTFFSFAPFLNVPWGVIWPVFLALPFAAVQVFWLQRIANGGRTLWNFLTALSAATFGLSIYMLALTFWIR